MHARIYEWRGAQHQLPDSPLAAEERCQHDQRTAPPDASGDEDPERAISVMIGITHESA
jgi:hypothetical protein